MKINIISIFPEIFESLKYGVVGKALSKKLISLNHIDLKKFSTNNYGSIDDTPYGGGEGMVLSAEPLYSALKEIKGKSHVIYLSPQGVVLDQKKSKKLSEIKEITLICGRYEGIDQRIIDNYVDEEISIGDYVLSGGEIAGCVLIDSISRNLEEVLGNKESLENDSLSDGKLKGHIYTKPVDFRGVKVPEVLLSGNHKKITEWRIANSLWTTKQKRPDLFEDLQLSDKEMILLREYEARIEDQGKKND
tara:strand:+ start:94 stop:837 length:744 start_codon:yes stop_codon:yes gene_type:complete